MNFHMKFYSFLNETGAFYPSLFEVLNFLWFKNANFNQEIQHENKRKIIVKTKAKLYFNPYPCEYKAKMWT